MHWTTPDDAARNRQVHEEGLRARLRACLQDSFELEKFKQLQEAALLAICRDSPRDALVWASELGGQEGGRIVFLLQKQSMSS